MAHRAVARPLGERALAHEPRLDPAGVLGLRRALDRRGLRRAARSGARPDRGACARRSPCRRAPRTRGRPARAGSTTASKQRADVVPGAGHRDVPDDRALLPLVEPQLDPVAGAARRRMATPAAWPRGPSRPPALAAARSSSSLPSTARESVMGGGCPRTRPSRSSRRTSMGSRRRSRPSSHRRSKTAYTRLAAFGLPTAAEASHSCSAAERGAPLLVEYARLAVDHALARGEPGDASRPGPEPVGPVVRRGACRGARPCPPCRP